ncbi:MAG: FAD-dependent monooxygenase [Thermoleophilia bacterium]|jgi:2-polyprenyl-6-methoxyphenol hydroxylase-like FAD-dependent oxidoreductase
MRIVIVGGGVVGLTLWRILDSRGIEATVLDRGNPGASIPRPFLLPYHGFEGLRAAGVFDAVRAIAWEVAPEAPQGTIALTATFTRVNEILAEGVPVRYRTEVTGLLRDGDRVTGVQITGPGGEQDLAADLVVACDGLRSPVRTMAGIEPESRLADGAHLSWLSPVVIDRSFAMHYQADGRQVGLLGWPEGSAGWWDIERCGEAGMKAPGLERFKAAFAALLPPAAPALEGLTSVDDLVYRELTILRCEEWWRPGVVVIGDAAHFLGPEAGIGAGLGLGDAHALAEAIAANRDDPDAACADYERWRGPAVRPYEAIGAEGARIVRGGEKPSGEIWPPPA